METSQHWDYDLLISLVSKRNPPPSVIENLKASFKNEIQSERRYASIKSIEELIECLDKRGIISEYQIAPLYQLAEELEDDEIYQGLDQYVLPPKPKELQNIYALRRNQELEKSKDSSKPSLVKVEQKSVTRLGAKRQQIYKQIALDIGRHWRFFGRELNVRAGDLDNIDRKHHDLPSKVYEVLDVFENDPRNNPDNHFTLICDALDNSKRKDIRKDIQKIMSY